MANVFTFNAIKPGTYDVSKIKQAIMTALQDEGGKSVQLLNETTTTWGDRPVMGYKVEMRGPDAVMIARTQGSGPGVDHWWWLEKGTSIRYAHMSRDWVSKTMVNRLRAGAGAGQVVVQGRKAGAHKGIDARNWIPLIERTRRKPFADAIRRAVASGLVIRK